ncbi:MAG: hypothetical protein ACJ79K_06495 [Gemmatimonadaceae bacterium]
MRAASITLSLTTLALSGTLHAQTRVSPLPPNPPAVAHGHARNLPPGADEATWPDSIDASEIRMIADSMRTVGQQLKDARMNDADAARIGELEGRLGELGGRLGAMQGRLGALQGQLGRMQVRVGDINPQVAVHVGHPLSHKALMQLISRVQDDPNGTSLPPSDSIAPTSYAVAAGTTAGRVAAAGDLDVYGTVNGNAVALNGDVIVHRGARITGDALAVGGTVRLDGGTVDGEMRSLDRAVGASRVAAAASSSGFLSILDELQTAMGSLVVMVLLGFAAMVFAEERLRVVASAIETRFGRSLLAGILSEVSFIPVLVLAVVLLAITIVGIILLPVAIPGLFVVAALLAALGFLAVSRVAGQALTRRAATVSVRGAELRSMLAGLFFFFGLWLVAAILSWVPVLGSLLHALAFVVTWAAATVGLGAAVITRGGGRPATSAIAAVPETSELGWQTPTPISGIAAARRQATNTPEV